jgi:hypothetical protein
MFWLNLPHKTENSNVDTLTIKPQQVVYMYHQQAH